MHQLGFIWLQWDLQDISERHLKSFLQKKKPVKILMDDLTFWGLSPLRQLPVSHQADELMWPTWSCSAVIGQLSHMTIVSLSPWFQVPWGRPYGSWTGFCFDLWKVLIPPNPSVIYISFYSLLKQKFGSKTEPTLKHRHIQIKNKYDFRKCSVI